MTSKILGWPGYMVFQQEIDEKAKTLKLWVRSSEKVGVGGLGGVQILTRPVHLPLTVYRIA
jgi:hypothetical protein